MDKKRLAEMFEEVALMMEIQGENPFKARAYENAARALQGVEEDLETLARSGGIEEIRGLGKSMREKTLEAAETGRLEIYEELRSSIPSGLLEMVEIPGLGAKKTRAIHEKLGVDSIEGLEAACRDGRVEALSGFGAKSAQKILKGIEFRRAHASRFRLDVAFPIAESLVSGLRSDEDVIRVAYAGSLRRGKETVGDLDILVSTKNPDSVIESFLQWDEIDSVIARGKTKVSVSTEVGLQVDLRLVSDQQFPFALHYFTGSKEHNIQMRKRAIERGFTLNEYGLFPKDAESADLENSQKLHTEGEIFEALGLDEIPPELREDRGEFEAAERGEIPRLLEWTSLKGSLHNHTNWSDGAHTLEQTARYMIDLGLEYWAITDHSKSSFQANGLNEARLEKQVAAIREVNDKLAKEGHSFRLLTGIEVDILADGSLDFSEDVLSELDIVVASVHSSFTQSKKAQTTRILKAIEAPSVRFLGHLTGRLLLERDAYEVDIEKIIKACAEHGVAIELNASPYRMDMDWRWWRYAVDCGVQCAINVDAHRNEHASFLRIGASVARKGWLTRKHVLNTRPYDDLTNWLKEGK